MTILSSLLTSISYKKNIKQLIIVHPSWWFRLIVGFMQNIVSSKFAKKIVNVESIEELESIIKTDDMLIPADVRAHDKDENGEVYTEAEMSKAKTIMDGGRRPKVFKVPLEESCPDSDYPEEIKALMEYLTNKGLKSDGIFRRAPNKETVRCITQMMDLHQHVNFSDYDIYTLASVLKEFIRGLPDTLIPESSYSLLTDASIMTMEDDVLIPYIDTNFIRPLDDRNKKLLKDLMMMSAMTAQLSTVNRMGVKSLAVVWAPNMIRMDEKGDEMKIIAAVIKIVECMIGNYDQMFCNKTWEKN